MITAALLLAAVQPLPAHNHSTRTVDRAWRNASLTAQPRPAKRLRDLRQAVQSLGSAEMERVGPSGL